MACTKETVKVNGLNIWSNNTDARSAPAVDIVAVQGLGADPFYTWVKKTRNSGEVMWPRDLLSPFFNNARVATYSYESDWRKRDIKTSLRECAEQLLNILFQHRQDADACQRPLILIGHSLGGLVIQQALVIAVHHREFAPIRLSVAGIIFLGAPFQGSDAAVYGKWLAQLSGLESSLLELLKRNNPTLHAISRDFWASHSDWDIVCFYENKKAAYGPWEIQFVEPQSATFLGKRMIVLNTDHSGLNKFDGEHDENFTKVLPEIQRMVKDGPSVVINRHRRIGADSINTAEPCSTVPFEEDEDFVGRENILEEMEKILSPNSGHRRVALVGPGGVGKTQIAVEYAVRLRKRNRATWVFWVHAGSAATFVQSYRAIAEATNIPGREDPTVDVLDLVLPWLKKEENGPWLMIVDNNDDAELLFNELPGSDQSCIKKRLVDYIPRTARGAVIVTTRNHRAGSKLCDRKQSIDVERMTESEATKLFLKKLQSQDVDEDSLGPLLTRLEYLPLAITQAIAFMSENGTTVAQYFELLTKSEAESIKLLSIDLGDERRDSQVPHSVISTWKLSFDQIKKEKPRAVELLSLMCFLNHRGIPKLLLLNEEGDGVDFITALAPLKSFRFIKTDKSGQSFEMHQLVQLSMKAWLQAQKETEKYRALALKSVADVFIVEKEEKEEEDEEDDDEEDWVLYQQLLPHAEIILAHRFVGSTNQKHKAKLLHNAAWYVSEQGDFRSAEKWMVEAVEIRTKEMGEEDLDTLKSMQQLSIAYSDMGKSKEAVELQKRVVRIRNEKMNGEDDSDSLDAMTLLATMYSRLGMWSEAEELGERVVKASEELNADETDIARWKRKLALIYKDSGKLKLAEKLAEEVFEQFGKTLGGEDHETLSCMHALVSIYGAQGKLDKATNLGMQVMETYKETLGDSHPSTLTIMGDMALIYDRQGKLEEARQFGESLVVACEETLGEDHPETLTSLSNLLSVYRRLGRFEEAEERGELVIEVSKRILGEKHRNTLLKMGDLASTYRDRGKLSEAAELGQLVLSTRKSTLEESHPDILVGITNLASTYREQGRLADAEELEKSAESLRQKQGDEHPRVMASNNNLASIYRKQGRLQEAEELGSQVLKKRREVLGNTHPDTLVTATELALTYHKQGRYLKMQETLLGLGHSDTPSGIMDFAGTPEYPGKPKELEGVPEARDKGVEGGVAGAEGILVAKTDVPTKPYPLVQKRWLVWYFAIPGFAVGVLIIVMLVASRFWRV